MQRINIKFLTKKGCILCNNTIFVLRKLKTKFNLKIQIVDIEKDLKYFELYKNTIPVILINEKIVNEGKINETIIRKEIEKILKI